MNEKRTLLDRVFGSAKDALSIGNLIKRLLFMLFFGFWLGIRGLVSNIDSAGANREGFIGFVFALTGGMWDGVRISLASTWSFVQANFGIDYIVQHAWGSFAIGIIMAIMLIGFFFQPISLIINLLDFSDSSDTGNKEGQAVMWIVRFTITIFIVLILSALTFYTGDAESLLTPINDIDIVDAINGTINETTNQDKINSGINMLIGDGDS